MEGEQMKNFDTKSIQMKRKREKFKDKMKQKRK